jgi:hypothetical protein
MARWGSCDFKQLEELAKKIEKMSKFDVQKFCEDVSRELAARLLAKVIKRTPVGEGAFEVIKKDGSYRTYKIKNGGTLRRGWTAKTQEEAEGGKVPNAKEYADSLKILRLGNNYIIIVKNPVEYSSYVEFGHRQEPGRFVPALGKKLKSAWVNGHFMLTISEKELESQLPKIIERKLTKFMEECFNNGY